MAGQSITFDFLTTGADRTASGFRKVADNTVLAAKGAKVLSNVIETLGDKEGRTAKESATLARALRLTGDAEDRVAARAVVADAAIRRLDDAMQDTTRHSAGLDKALKGLSINPGLLGPAIALIPALGTLSGVVAGAAIGLGGAFVAAGGALTAFGAVAKPVLTDAKKAAGDVGKAQSAYNTAIAGGTKKAVAYKAEQAAIGKAYAGMSPQQIALSRQLGTMGDAWDKVKAAQTPVVAGALQPWLKSVTGLTAALGPVIAKVSPVIRSLGTQFDSLVTSSAFRGFRDFIGSTGAAAVSAGGSTIIDLVKSFMILLPRFDPLIREAVGWISRLGPAVLKWSESKKSSDQIQAFLRWFSQNGPVVGQFLKSIGAALAALAPGLTSGGALELKALTTFLNFVAKLPPGLAKPLAEVAGAMLILQKTGVVTVGIKLTGLATGATAAGAAGGPLTAAGAAIAGGIILGIRHALAAGWKTAVAELPKLLEGVGSILNFSASGWAQAILDHFAGPVRRMWDNLGHFLAASFDITRHQVARAWAVMTGDIAALFDIAKEHIRITWDQIKILFLRGVDFIMTTMGKLPGPLGAPFRAAHASIKVSLAQIQGDVASATRNIQADWDRIHGKTVQVHFVGSGGGNVTFQQTGGSADFPIVKGSLAFHAAGGRVGGHGGPRADNQLIAASPGEFVHQVTAVNKYGVPAMEAVNAGRAVIGYAAGGAVTGMGAADRIPAAGVPFMANAEAAFGRAAEGAFARAAIASLKKAVAKAAALVRASQPYGPLGDSGARSGSAALAQAFARSIMGQYHWGPEQWPPWLYLGNQESGWNAYAVNASSGAYGIGQSLGHGHPYNLGDYKTQVIWMANYIRGRYGNPANAWAHERAYNWYSGGGLVPGFASGGSVGTQGAAWLKAWQTRHGGGWGSAWGPVVLNEQIDRMKAAIGRAKSLSGAGGLSAGQHKFWAAAAADETKRLGVLGKELTTERAWRYQLGLDELGAGQGDPRSREPAVAGRPGQGVEGGAGPGQGHRRRHQQDAGVLRRVPGRAPGGETGPGAARGYPLLTAGTSRTTSARSCPPRWGRSRAPPAAAWWRTGARCCGPGGTRPCSTAPAGRSPSCPPAAAQAASSRSSGSAGTAATTWNAGSARTSASGAAATSSAPTEQGERLLRAVGLRAPHPHPDPVASQQFSVVNRQDPFAVTDLDRECRHRERGGVRLIASVDLDRHQVRDRAE